MSARSLACCAALSLRAGGRACRAAVRLQASEHIHQSTATAPFRAGPGLRMLFGLCVAHWCCGCGSRRCRTLTAPPGAVARSSARAPPAAPPRARRTAAAACTPAAPGATAPAAAARPTAPPAARRRGHLLGRCWAPQEPEAPRAAPPARHSTRTALLSTCKSQRARNERRVALSLQVCAESPGSQRARAAHLQDEEAEQRLHRQPAAGGGGGRVGAACRLRQRLHARAQHAVRAGGLQYDGAAQRVRGPGAGARWVCCLRCGGARPAGERDQRRAQQSGGAAGAGGQRGEQQLLRRCARHGPCSRQHVQARWAQHGVRRGHLALAPRAPEGAGGQCGAHLMAPMCSPACPLRAGPHPAQARRAQIGGRSGEGPCAACGQNCCLSTDRERVAEALLDRLLLLLAPLRVAPGRGEEEDCRSGL